MPKETQLEMNLINTLGDTFQVQYPYNEKRGIENIETRQKMERQIKRENDITHDDANNDDDLLCLK